ncbi:positive regulation of MHC class I biosynthetic process [Branchiostoma belcheri]|nr:positive regulation of MHC class I biosynthetic process [Branchiostoma belcheri]
MYNRNPFSSPGQPAPAASQPSLRHQPCHPAADDPFGGSFTAPPAQQPGFSQPPMGFNQPQAGFGQGFGTAPMVTTMQSPPMMAQPGFGSPAGFGASPFNSTTASVGLNTAAIASPPLNTAGQPWSDALPQRNPKNYAADQDKKQMAPPDEGGVEGTSDAFSAPSANGMAPTPAPRQQNGPASSDPFGFGDSFGAAPPKPTRAAPPTAEADPFGLGSLNPTPAANPAPSNDPFGNEPFAPFDFGGGDRQQKYCKASGQRGRKRKAECEVEAHPDSDRSTCDDGGTWECKVSEDTQAKKIRLCLSRHPQCLSSEDSSSHRGQESPGTVSDSSNDCLSTTATTEYSHSTDTRIKSANFDSSHGTEDIVPRKKLPPDEAPSCSHLYTEERRIHEPKLEMYQPPLTPVETPPLMYTAVCGSHQDGECVCHEQEQLYPTPEDAWAWLHCVDEFFQKDSTAAMAIRTAWSANQLAKHIIRDRYYHPFLCRYWQEKAVFPDSFSDFMDFLVFTSAQDFCVKNGVSLPDVSFRGKCLRLGEIAFIHQTAYGSKCQLAAEEDLPAFSFGWLQRCQNSPTARLG